MASTLSTFSAFTKVTYTKEKIQDLTEADNPTLALLPKSDQFVGESMVIPVIDANPQGTAAQTLAIAQGAATNITGKKFTVTTADYFGSVDIGGKVMAASRNNMGAFLENKKSEIDGLYTQIGNNFEKLLWGNGGGAIGRIAVSGITGNVITLANKEDIWAFEPGMTFAVSGDGDGSAGTEALRAGTSTVTVVDRENGKFTAANLGNITGEADNDYIFRYGDFLGATGTNLLKGVQAYITSSSSPGALYGMTRTSDPTRLAGCRIPTADLTGLGIEDRIKLLGARMSGTYGAKIGKHAFLHPEDWQDLEIALSSRGVRSFKDDSTKFGFSVLECVTGGQSVKLYAARAVPRGTAFILKLDHWKLWSMEELIHPVTRDGLTILRKSTTNDFEYRLESWPALVCNAPLHNGRVALT
jgi:hypothetical protein